MADNQTLNEQMVGANAATAGKPNRSVIGVWDELLNSLNDRLSNVESAIRENTAQYKMQWSTVGVLRDAPKKLEALEGQLEALEGQMKALEKHVVASRDGVIRAGERVALLEYAVQDLVPRHTELAGKFGTLGSSLDRHGQVLDNAVKQGIRCTHDTPWAILIVLLLLFTTGWVIYKWNDTRSDADRYMDSDIVLRGTMLRDSSLRRSINREQRLFADSSEQYRKRVIEEEQHRSEIDEKRAEIDELNKQEKKR